MKKFFKALSLILALTLIIGTIPVSAADEVPAFEILKGRTDWKLYLGGAMGQKEDGTLCKTKDRYRLSKLVVGFDKEIHDIKLESADKKIVTTSDIKDKVYAKKIGTAAVTIYIYDKETEKLLDNLTIDIVVKKNATEIKYAVTDAEGNAIDLENKLGVNVPYTVTLTRRGDVDKDGDGKMDIVDTDYRTLECDDTEGVDIVSANKYGTVYTVTFTKAGKFTLKAGSYQSKLFNKQLLLEDIEVVAGYDAVAVAQSGLASADVTFDTNVVGLTADAFKAYYLVGETKIYPSAAQKVECKDNVATVTFLSNFLQGTEFFVEYDGVKVGSFTAATITADSIVAIEIPAQQFEAGASDCKLEYKLLNADGIDCKDLLGSTLNGVLSFEIVNGDIDTYITSGNVPVIYIGTADKSYVVKATYTWINSNGDTKTAVGQGNVASIKPAEWVLGTVTGVVGIGNPDYINGDFSLNGNAKTQIWALGDDAGTSGAALQIAVPYTKNGNTVNEGFNVNAGVGKFASYTAKSSEESVVMLATAVANGQKWYLKANKAGTSTIIIYGVTSTGAQVAIGAVPVEVKAARVATTFTVTPNKNTLNEGYEDDEIKFTVTLKDQYGEEMKGVEYTVANANANDGSAGPVVGFWNYDLDADEWYTTETMTGNTGEAFYLYGDDVTTKAGTLNLKFTCGSLSQTVFINCGNEAEAKTYVLKLSTNTLDTAVKGDTEAAYCDIYLEGRSQSGYAADGADIYFVEATPKTEASVSGYSIKVAGDYEYVLDQKGDELYVYTVNKDGAVKKASELKNFDCEGFFYYDNFKAVDSADGSATGAAVKMDKGTYTITAYKIYNDGVNVIVSVVGTQVLTVNDNQILPNVTKKANAEKLESLDDVSIASAFDVTFNGSADGIICHYNYTVDGANKTAYVASVDVTIINDNGIGYFTINKVIDTLVKVK